MAEWQYMVVQIGYPNEQGGGKVKWVNGGVDNRFGKNETRIIDALATLGAEGWELVGIDNFSPAYDPLYIFKRPVEEHA